MTEGIVDNPSWAEARPRVSVLMPFLRDDPRSLLAELDAQQVAEPGQVEVVVLDDGTGDEQLAVGVAAVVQDMRLPARFVRLTTNAGRGPARNRLAAHARGEHLLFLDSDMRPDAPSFLGAYLDLVEHEQPAVVFGGFSITHVPTSAATALHRGLSAARECLPAEARRRNPAKFVFTSNLLVRRDVFESESFDERFSGWGWEDVEWAARVARSHDIVHVDNPASHLGLQDDDVLVRRFERSAANFALLAAEHPTLAATLPSYRAARVLRRVPLLPTLRPVLRRLTLTRWLPIGARVFLVRLYRAAVYVDAL